MLLSQLQAGLLKAERRGGDAEVTSLSIDSRSLLPGALFIALRGGGIADRHGFISDAIARGAAALLVEEEQLDVPIPQVIVPDVRVAAGIVADRFYGHPSHQMKVIGVTGTNGKTTTTHLIEHVLQSAGHKVGLLGTIGMRIDGEMHDVGNTTPESVGLQAALAQMAVRGCAYAVMEVSSHALDLKRDAGTRYRTAVFTNLTQDHLDYHGTMDDYRAAKGKLFARLGNRYGDNLDDMAYGVVNADDPSCRYMVSQTVAECVTYGIDLPADVRALDVVLGESSAAFWVQTFAGEAHVKLPATGRFNVYNALAAISVGLIERIALADIVHALATAPQVPGRLEPVEAGQPFKVYVDYSHTPDSLENALKQVRQQSRGKVITVFGCGGDRDKTKRPIMARIALQYSDLAVLTSDNPRTEDPDAILDDMEAGIRPAKTDGVNKTYLRIRDRQEAIEHAIRSAGPEDIVLIAGKGHETYQIIGTVKHHFDDREVAREAIRRRLG